MACHSGQHESSGMLDGPCRDQPEPDTDMDGSYRLPAIAAIY